MPGSIIRGITPTGKIVTLRLNNDGTMPTTGGSGGDATAANQLTEIARLEAIRDRLASTDFATQTTLAAILAKLIAAPATEAKQDALVVLETAIRDRLPSALVSDRLKVDGSAVTQPISGSVSVGNFPATQSISGSVAVSNLPATQPISATALPLPTNAATDAMAQAIRDRLPSAGTASETTLVQVRDRPIIQPATTRTTTTTALTTALQEASVPLTNAKKLSIHARNNVDIRFDTTLGNTINTPNFTTIRAGQEYSETELNFSGTLYFSAETIPSTSVASCTTTSGSPTVTAGAGAFSGITLGQAVTGTGIAANTIVVARNAAGSSITLSQNATASATVSLTFTGAVVRIESWS